MYQGLKPDSYQTPPARTLVTTLVPERVRRVRRSPGLPRLGIHQPDPWARAGPAGTAPPAHPQLSDQARQKRKARTAPRTRGPIVFPVYPPTPLRNTLNSQEPVDVFVPLVMARYPPPRTWSRWGKRREVKPSPTLPVPPTCPRHRTPPSPSSPVVGARVPRPWLPHLRLRALKGPGRRHPLFAALGAVVAQLQPQPRGESRRPVPCLSGPASALASP